ncbi:MAG: cyclic peptide transporter [Bacteroidetes bacterium]|nr:cyclic peptide transporter [Bacteroidota bacterium]
MNIIKLLNSRSKYFLILITVLGLISSLWNLGLLYLINNAIIQKNIILFPGHDWVVFVVMLVASFVVMRYFQSYTMKLTNEVIYEYSIAIVEKVRFASFADVEKMGKEKVYTAVKYARDVGVFPQMFVQIFNSAIVVLCCLVYMFIISPVAALISVCLIGILFIFFFRRNKQIEKDFFKLRMLEEAYFSNLEDLMVGYKEIKMSIRRSNNIYEKFLLKNRKEAKDLNTQTAVKYIHNDLIAYYSWFVGIGIILYILPGLIGMRQDQITSFVISTLYIISPVAALTASISKFTQLKTAFDCLVDFDKDLNWEEAHKVEVDHNYNSSAFDTLKLEEVTYEYLLDTTRQKTFEFGPINLEIKNNEIVFIAGSNGSGKSTFINLLAGLYTPKSGNIYMNGNPVTKENYPYFRNQFAAIFAGGYIFTDNYNDFVLEDNKELVDRFIDKMKLTDKISIISEKGVIDRKLSKGQQKRVAMIYALMENKQVFIFDEWAAEQDPSFRIFFYRELLPELKREGKTVIAVTHDDEFYSCADRVVKFDYGKIKYN